MDEKKLLEGLRRQLGYLYTLDFYHKKMDKAGIVPRDILSLKDFESIPFTTHEEFVKEMDRNNPSYGSFFPPDVVRINFTPSGDHLLPIFHTANDLEFMHHVCHRSLEAAGVTRNDICAVTFGYHLFIAGLFYQGQLETYGAKVIPLGPGETSRAVDIINRHNVTVLVANPSFALKLASSGISRIRILFAGGEPLTSVPGYKDRIRQALGRDLVIIDSYSMSECIPIARNCAMETGLHIMDEFVYAEIIDPETGKTLENGHIGELVLTHMKKEAQPLLRYRTGDLAELVETSCKCGRYMTMPRGISGRTDEMLKVKGVKLYPSQIKTIIEEHGIGTGFRLTIRSEKGADRLTLTLKDTSGARSKTESLRHALRKATLLNFNEIVFSDRLEEGPRVSDEREMEKQK